MLNFTNFQNETEAAEAEEWAGAGCAAPAGSHRKSPTIMKDTRIPYTEESEDSKLLDWLETKFDGRWRESIFIAHELGADGVLVMDSRGQPGVVHRAKTVRGAIRLAMQHDDDEDEND